MNQKTDAAGRSTSIDKALAVCEELSAHIDGLSLAELARALDLPAPTAHRLLSVLKRRGYVRQDDDTSVYRMTLKVLDLGFRVLGRSRTQASHVPGTSGIRAANGRALLYRGACGRRGDLCVEGRAG